MDVLTLLVVIPLVTAGILVAVPASQAKTVKTICTIATALTLGIALYLFREALVGGPERLAEISAGIDPIPWIESVGISWHVSVDGMSVVMILLNAIVMFAGTLVSAHAIQKRAKEFFLLFMALGAGVFGVFTVRDMFFMYFSFELAVVPMYLLIGVWGSKEREYAAMKLTLYLTAGALVALIGLLLLYFETWGYLKTSTRTRCRRSTWTTCSRPRPRGTSATASSKPCSGSCSSASRRSSRCGRSTRGVPSDTPRRRPPVR